MYNDQWLTAGGSSYHELALLCGCKSVKLVQQCVQPALGYNKSRLAGASKAIMQCSREIYWLAWHCRLGLYGHNNLVVLLQAFDKTDAIEVDIAVQECCDIIQAIMTVGLEKALSGVRA